MKSIPDANVVYVGSIGVLGALVLGAQAPSDALGDPQQPWNQTRKINFRLKNIFWISKNTLQILRGPEVQHAPTEGAPSQVPMRVQTALLKLPSRFE